MRNWDPPWFFGWEIEGDTKKMKYKQVKSSVSRAADNKNRCLVAQKSITTTMTLITIIAASKILLSHFTHPFLFLSYEHKTIKRENLFAWHRRFVFLPSFVFIWLLLSSFCVFSLPLSFSVCVVILFFHSSLCWSLFLGFLVLKSNVLPQHIAWLSIVFASSSYFLKWAKGYVARPIRAYLFCLPFHIHTYKALK